MEANNLVSVTQILGLYQNFGNVTKFKLEAACQRGSVVDLKCKEYAKKRFVFPPAEKYRGYFVSFTNWFDQCVEKVHAIDPEWIYPELGLVGHPDFLFTLRNEEFKTLVDTKTPIIEALITSYPTNMFTTETQQYMNLFCSQTIFLNHALVLISYTSKNGISILDNASFCPTLSCRSSAIRRRSRSSVIDSSDVSVFNCS